MTAPTTLAVAAVVLGAGTFTFRFAGPVLRVRVELSVEWNGDRWAWVTAPSRPGKLVDALRARSAR